MRDFTDRIKLTHEILSKIPKIDEFKGLWQGGLRFSPQTLGSLKALVIITSTGASTRIEGAQMNNEDVARLLRGLKSRLPKGRDEQEVAGYANLLSRIFDNYRTLKLTENSILQFHSILLQFSEKDQHHHGRYKGSDNAVVMKTVDGQTVVLFRPTQPYLVRPEMEEIIAWANAELERQAIHPLLVIANFIFEFLAIHPFSDGNGRLSRALTNLLLLRTGYAFAPYISLDEIIEERRTDYYLALRAAQQTHKTDREDITPWVHYLLDAILEQVERGRKLLGAEQPEKLLSPRQLRVYDLFSDGPELGVAEIYRLLHGGIPPVTIKQALTRLVAMRLLERIGQARSTRYRKLH